MISWTTIAYGAALSALVAGVLVALVVRGQHRVPVALTAALGAAAGPIAWNAILRATHGTSFFTDAPFVVMPASWQDTGSGVFTLGATAILLGFGLLRHQPAQRTVSLALLAALAAFLVDVYLY